MPARSDPADASAITEGLKAAASEVSGRPSADIALDSELDADLGIDSLEFVQLIQAIEDRLGVRLPDEALAGVRTLRDLVPVIAASPDQ